MLEFDENAKYCCGSLSDKRQFCCNYYDKFGNDEFDFNVFKFTRYDLQLTLII